MSSEKETTEELKELNELFHKGMLRKMDMFVSSLQDTPDVTQKLFDLQVLTQNEKIAIVSKPVRQHQKEALFYILFRKNFVDINLIIHVLHMTGNESLRATLLLLKLQIYKQKRFDPEILKKPSENFNLEDEKGDMHESRWKEKDDNLSKGQRLTFQSAKPTNVAEDMKRSATEATMSILMARSPTQDFSLGIEANPDLPKLDVFDFDHDEEMENELDYAESFFHAASNGQVDDLEQLLDEGKNPYVIEARTWKTPLHAAVTGNNSQVAVLCLEKMVNAYLSESGEDEADMTQKRSGFLNHQDKDGNTIMHLAAENESVDIVRRFYSTPYYCDLFIPNHKGLTALEIMYIKTPEAVVHVLNDAVPTTNNHPSDGKFTLEIDFRNVIGSHEQEALSDNARYSETDILAKLVHQDSRAAKIILSHVIVKTFLDLKWEKMKIWLYSSIILQILLHLWYTLFVVQVFLINCPYSKSKRNKSRGHPSALPASALEDDDPNGDRSILGYLFGNWETVEQAFTISPNESGYHQICTLSSGLTIQGTVLLVIGGLFLLKEICELILVSNIFSSGTNHGSGRWKNFQMGFIAYIKSVENIFQLVYIGFMITVCTLVFQKNNSDFYYSCAAVSIMFAWTLILMQVGNIYGLGTYVQILGKVIKSFATLMGTYLVLFIAFSISFSIMFPEMEPFQTLPKSLSRVITMMTGELNYDDTFYANDHSGPPIPFTGHIIYTSFTLLLTIVLINLLTGVVVNDVEGLMGKSEVILRSIQVEQLYVMEKSLLRFRWILLPIRKVFNRLRGIKEETAYLGIFVVNPHRTSGGMVVKKTIKEIPHKLRKDLRALAENKDDYMRKYVMNHITS